MVLTSRPDESLTAVSVVFVRRQSPDWESLSKDFLAGKTIDPKRYVPDHEIFGFPGQVNHLIERWNNLLSVDFFSFRHFVANLSRESVNAVSGSRSFNYDELSKVAALQNDAAFYVYFHDDDDFFAPQTSSVVKQAYQQTDTLITPLFRVGSPTFTFVREGFSSDIIWERAEPPSFRFQTNNYGINRRRCRTEEHLFALKDHVLASRYADENGFLDQVLTVPISATIKTPGSASMLPSVLATPNCTAQKLNEFIRAVRSSTFPSDCEWITNPVLQIIDLIEKIEAKCG